MGNAFTPMRLTTWSHQKYADQPVALVNAEVGGLNLKVFDAVELFMTDNTWKNRKVVFDSGKAKEFAEQFIAQFNAGAAYIEPYGLKPGEKK